MQNLLKQQEGKSDRIERNISNIKQKLKHFCKRGHYLHATLEFSLIPHFKVFYFPLSLSFAADITGFLISRKYQVEVSIKSRK